MATGCGYDDMDKTLKECENKGELPNLDKRAEENEAFASCTQATILAFAGNVQMRFMSENFFNKGR